MIARQELSHRTVRPARAVSAAQCAPRACTGRTTITVLRTQTCISPPSRLHLLQVQASVVDVVMWLRGSFSRLTRLLPAALGASTLCAPQRAKAVEPDEQPAPQRKTQKRVNEFFTPISASVAAEHAEAVFPAAVCVNLTVNMYNVLMYGMFQYTS